MPPTKSAKPKSPPSPSSGRGALPSSGGAGDEPVDAHAEEDRAGEGRVHAVQPPAGVRQRGASRRGMPARQLRTRAVQPSRGLQQGRGDPAGQVGEGDGSGEVPGGGG